MARGRFSNPAVAALHGFYDLWRKQELEHRLRDDDSFWGRTVLVTGASSGLGLAIAIEASRRGGRVILGIRSQGGETRDAVCGASGADASAVLVRPLDLSDIDSIHGFVDGLEKEGVVVDVVYLNAASAAPGSRKTCSGQDELFLVNYLSNFILVNLMLSQGVIHVPAWAAAGGCNGEGGKGGKGERGKGGKGASGKGRGKGSVEEGGASGGSPGAEPRIIFITSNSHVGSSAIDYDEFGRYFEYGVSKAISNYSYFKLMLNTFATELSRRLNGYAGDGVGPEGKGAAAPGMGPVKAQVNLICPGPVNTNIIREVPFILRMILRAIFMVMFRSPTAAARPAIYLGVSDDWAGKTNQYMHMFTVKRMDEKVYDVAEGEKLWKESARLWSGIDKQAAVYC
eukprot:jgi/Mesvir1/12616/Mv16077-RA.1